MSKPPLTPAEPDLPEEEADRVDPTEALAPNAIVHDAVAVDGSCANVRAGGAKLRRVRFENVRLTGADLAEAEIEDAVFADCRVDLVSFRLAKLARVRFERCRMEEADFQAAALSSVVFVDCDLRRAGWGEAGFVRSEMRGCTLAGAQSPERLRGVRMPWPDVLENAAELAAAVGIEILED